MRKSKGFTLIELLVVIAIIGILAAIVLVSIARAKDRAKDARVQIDMTQLRISADLYYTGSDSYNNFFGEIGPQNLFEDIELQVGGSYYSYATGPDADLIATKYCAVGKLNTGEYWCVDDNLVSKKYAGSPVTCIAGADPRCE